MSWLASFTLAAFHAVYWLVTIAKRLLTIADQPLPLAAARQKLPSHLALLLVTDHRHNSDATEDSMIESVERAVTWCRAAGIDRLTVYDREGLLSTLSLDIRKRLVKRPATPSTDSDLETEIEFPLTPPSSDDSDSRPLSPDSEVTPCKLKVTTVQIPGHAEKGKRKALGVKSTTRRRRPTLGEPTPTSFTLHILSRKSGKPAIAEVANALLRRRSVDRSSSRMDKNDRQPASLETEVTSLLQGDGGFPEPDLMIVHHMVASSTNDLLELHGFPPWQIRLTEFDDYKPMDIWWRGWGHQRRTAGRPLDEIEFRKALDTYAAAEMRLGK
ncbi:uncharacterized protein C8Q71DRAFT_757185 [Rhodofomes roseus]|uniref:ditrans,polycis-polyprenyl diphosphate synthase [(2E,6E)-farnesyldiphosphate specific] n=1 Tax=Rhodofomes roseus TaxID=34475 RepID=A0ABQ8KHS0_9APHY|nr:uncharacterized protein C8Q71DRAFT_757185 [Rhodofomes roseus]KAH9837211.1 hypothetical protein C8Q71DRAFT_757185 [Rhodofomes roseus]